MTAMPTNLEITSPMGPISIPTEPLKDMLQYLSDSIEKTD